MSAKGANSEFYSSELSFAKPIISPIITSNTKSPTSTISSALRILLVVGAAVQFFDAGVQSPFYSIPRKKKYRTKDFT